MWSPTRSLAPSALAGSRLRASLRVPWGPVLAALAGLVVALPLFLGPLPATHDGLHHLFRLFELDQALRAGHLFPRMLSGMGFEYGYPVLNFYAPLGYYLAWVGAALGAGYIGGIRLAHAVGLAAGAAAMYGWARLFLPRPAALLAAVAYTAFPYRIADVYVRGALAEALAFVFPPLLLWLGTLMREEGERRLAPAFALATASFVLTHNLTALMFAPALGLYFLLVYGVPRSDVARLAYARLVGAGLAGLALAGFFWLPAITEVRYVLAGQVSGLGDLLSLLEPLGQWFSPYPLHRYTPMQGVAAQHPFGLVQTALVLAGTGALLWRWRRLPALARQVLAFALVVTAGTTFLLLPASAPLWERLPLLHLMQFPWRLQAVLTLCTAVLAAGAVVWLRPGMVTNAAVVALSAAIVIGGLGGLALEPAHLPGYDHPLVESDINHQGLIEYDYQTALWLREHGGDWLLEYLPIWALPHRADFFLVDPGEEAALPPAPITGARVLAATPLSLDIEVSLSAPGTLTFHRFYFPGWRVTADGQPLETRPTGPLGLLGVDLPAGDHLLRLRPGLTPARALGYASSVLALGAMGAWAWRVRSRWPLALAAAAVIFGALVAFRAYRYPTSQAPTAVQAQVGDAAHLIGFHARPAGDQLEVTLYWLALNAAQNDYRVFVHAVDPSGGVAAQDDGRPGMEFSPTTRWVPGEIVADRHLLPLPAGPVSLYAGMYTWPEVANLPALQDGTEAPGGRVFLGDWSPQ